MARASEPSGLSHEKKRNKFVRLVLLLTIRKHGVGIILSLFFTFLLAAVISAVDDIWTEFQRFQSCQEDFLSGVSQSITDRYNQATRSVAASTVGKAACVAASMDICTGATEAAKGVAEIGKGIGGGVASTIGGRRLSGACSGSPLLDVFRKWSVPGNVDFPQVNMGINSNTDEVLAQIKHDLHFLEAMAKWTRYAGWFLAGISVIIILVTAARYTLKNKAWKPSKISYTMHFINFLKVVGCYGLSVLVVMLQAYSTRKFCDIAIQSIDVDAPDCVVNGDCGFGCQIEEVKFMNTCRRCNIKLHWWWREVFSTVNILLAAYFVFTILVLVFERREARLERRELSGSSSERHNASASILANMWHRLVSWKKQTASAQMQGLGDCHGNDLDGPLESGTPRYPTKYAESICSYPDRVYTGGLR